MYEDVFMILFDTCFDNKSRYRLIDTTGWRYKKNI